MLGARDRILHEIYSGIILRVLLVQRSRLSGAARVEDGEKQEQYGDLEISSWSGLSPLIWQKQSYARSRTKNDMALNRIGQIPRHLSTSLLIHRFFRLVVHVRS